MPARNIRSAACLISFKVPVKCSPSQVNDSADASRWPATWAADDANLLMSGSASGPRSTPKISVSGISYAVFCLKKKKKRIEERPEHIVDASRLQATRRAKHR